MSKNERFFRTASAGIFFAILGIFAITSDDGGVDANRGRGPATLECATPGCAALARVKHALFSNPGSDSLGDSAAQAATEKREAKLLREAGGILAVMFQDEPIGNGELEAATRFLFDTFPRDGAGIAIDALSLGLGEEKTAKALAAIEAEIDSLAAEGVVSGAPFRTFKAALAMARSAGGDLER
jgi:hypothetical protein